MPARSQLNRERTPTASAADDQAPRQRSASTLTLLRLAAIFTADFLAGALRQATGAAARVRRLEQLIQVAVSEVRVAALMLMRPSVASSQPKFARW